MKKIIFSIIYIVVSFFIVWGCFMFVKWDAGMAEWTIRERGWILFTWVCTIIFLPLLLINIESDD